MSKLTGTIYLGYVENDTEYLDCRGSLSSFPTVTTCEAFDEEPC
jgi:hypothetical protein